MTSTGGPPFPRLFSPVEIGPVTLRNRIVMLPHGTSMVVDGAPTDDDIAYYEDRARSGVGLMITGAAVVSPDTARRGRKLIEAYNDQVLPALARRAAAVRAQGAAIVGQIIHLGRESIGMESDHPLLAPSPIRSPRDPFPPHEMDDADIRRIIADFARSAANLKATGHDGVEIHGAHGYLVGQFLSPATNHRDDGWGGDPVRRMRFLFELIDAIRTACGDDFLLGLRLSADEELANGLELSDTRRIVEAIARDHPVDYLSVTQGTRGAYVKDVTQPEATAARAAGVLRDASGLVTIVGQRFTSPALAEKALADGQADAVGFARAFVADGDWVAKAARGEANRIRPCVGLNQDCRAFAPHLHCAVNPLAGRERDTAFASFKPATDPRRIAIVGGGPAGMEAARIAALRGHRVTLYEANDGLGGQFLYAATIPERAGLLRLIDHLQSELRRLPVDVQFGRRIEQPDDLVERADAVVLATGAAPRPLDPSRHGVGVRAWLDILRDGAPAPHGAGQALVHDDGSGFWWTYGVANALVDAGWRVTLSTPSATIAGAIPAESVAPLLVRLGTGGTRYEPLSELLYAGDGVADLICLTSGDEKTIEADLVVVQTGRSPAGPAPAVFSARGLDVHTIGDCVAPRRLSQALFEAHRLAVRL
jgi:2,4-dienoyl-CoA reductase (NADPH2)